MDASFFENLLNESESNCLGFKQAEYRFDGASNEEKSELLKDILAFANTWRRTDTYILIGVMEVKGGQNQVVGISNHLDSTSLQQFVNNKVQKPIAFSYIPYEFEGKQVGIIHIPIQDRPFYLRQNYGKLKRNVVYLRRENSTDEAAPDEIAKMGATVTGGSFTQLPTLEFGFADLKSQRLYGHQVEITSQVLNIPDQIPDFIPTPKPFGFNTGLSGFPNRNFYRDLYQFYDFNLLLKPIRLRLTNTGRVIVYNARLEICIDANDIVILTRRDFPDRPKQRFKISDHSSFPDVEKINTGLTINHHKSTWTVSIQYGDIQPRIEDCPDQIVFMGSRKPQTLQIEAIIFADNVLNPIRLPLCIDFLIEQLPQTLDDLKKNYDEIIYNRHKSYDADED
jgi:hypothetical protein